MDLLCTVLEGLLLWLELLDEDDCIDLLCTVLEEPISFLELLDEVDGIVLFCTVLAVLLGLGFEGFEGLLS